MNKKRIALFLAPIALVLLLLIFSREIGSLGSGNQGQEGKSGTRTGMDGSDSSGRLSNRRERTPVDRVKSILAEAQNMGEYDPELLALIQQHEEEIFAYFATIRYPEVESTEDPLDRSDELAKIVKVLSKHFEGVPFAEVIQRTSVFESSSDIHNATLEQILTKPFDKPADADSIYQWFLENPEKNAVVHSGGDLGRILVNGGIDSAWEKTGNLPDGVAKKDAYNTIIAHSLNEGLDKAAELFNSMESDPVFDVAKETFIQHALQNDQLDPILLNWAAGIVDPKMRYFSISEIVSHSFHQDEGVAIQSWRKNVDELSQEVLDEVDLAIKQVALNSNADQLTSENKTR